MNKFFNFLASIISVIFVFLFLVCLYWLVYPFKVLEVKDVKILTPVVKLGDNFEMRVDFCKYGNHPATVNRTFYNDRAVVLTPYDSSLPNGCNKKIITIKVPENMFPAEYKLITCNEYQVNPIRYITVCYSTDMFRLIPADLNLDNHNASDQDKFEQLFRDHKLLMMEYKKIQNELKLKAL